MRQGHLLCISWLLTAQVVNGNCLHGTSLFARQVGGAVPFSYTGETGPLGWANLSTANAPCAISTPQSPINLDSSIQKSSVSLTMTIPSVTSAKFENLGTTVEVTVNGTISIRNETFSLKQFHFHTPSEHRINEEHFPLEIHLVHQAADGSLLVLGAPFELTRDGGTTALLTAVTKNIQKIATPHSVTETGALDFTTLINYFQTTPLFQYIGSLTTPPCSTGVAWLVGSAPLPLNVPTYLAFKNVIKFNARYTQNSLGRENLIKFAASRLPATPESPP